MNCWVGLVNKEKDANHQKDDMTRMDQHKLQIILRILEKLSREKIRDFVCPGILERWDPGIGERRIKFPPP
jgi:hypothetical protein